MSDGSAIEWTDATMRLNEIREEWLQRAVQRFRPVFKKAGWPFERIQVSIGWGYRRSDALGQCWPRKRSRDGSNQIFLVPTVDDPVEALETLAHELAHAADDCRHGHRKPFPTICNAVGLSYENAKSTPWSDAGRRWAESVIAELGPFPHPRIDVTNQGKQGTRLIKAGCAACGYTVRTTAKWLASRGAPLCPCSFEPMAAEGVDVAAPPSVVVAVRRLLPRLNHDERTDLIWDHLQEDPYLLEDLMEAFDQRASEDLEADGQLQPQEGAHGRHRGDQ